MNRRRFLQALPLTVAVAAGPAAVVGAVTYPGGRRMTMCLSCGSIGVNAKPPEVIELAQRYGFESVEPNADYLVSLSEDQLNTLVADLKAKGLVWGTANLSVEFRGDEGRFAEGMRRLPKVSAALQRAGVQRVGTWISPGHGSLTYVRNFRLHARRLREVASLLKSNGQRLGLEYVGTKTSRGGARYPFIHSLAEMKDLIAEIDTGHVGVVLDSWHWWQADDTEADLLSLRNDDVVSVDLNDAPAGVPKDQQIDGKRELPAATGVIDIALFLNALKQIGYDGPVRAEPFNRALNDLDNAAACAATGAAMKKAFALIR